MRQRKVKNLEEKMEAVRDFLVEHPSPDIWAEVFGRAARTDCPGRARAAAARDGTDAAAARDGTDAAAARDAGVQDPAGRIPARDLYLEIGCGKGDFLLQQALAHPEADFIGIEGQASVVLRAMEKAVRIEAGRPDEDDPDWLQSAAGPAGINEDAVNPGRPLGNVRFACAFVNGMEEFFAPGSLAGIYLNFSDPWPKGRHARRRLTWRGRLKDYAAALRPGGFIAFKTDNDALFDFTLEEIAACGWTPAELTRDLHGPGGRIYEARQIMTEYERKFHLGGRQIHYVKVIM